MYANADVNLSLYGDIIYPMARKSTVKKFLLQAGDGPVSNALKSIRPSLFNTLHPIPLEIFHLAPGTICNMGTTEEAFESLSFFKNEAKLKNLKLHDVNIALNSNISAKAFISENCFIEDSEISADVKIGNNCLISGCDILLEYNIPDNTALHTVMYKNNKWVCRCWGTNDDVKTKGDWFGQPLANLEPTADSLWNAKLFPICDTQNEALIWARRFFTGEFTEPTVYELWQTRTRAALSDIQDIDIFALTQRRKNREDKLRAEAFCEKILAGNPVAEILGYLGEGTNAKRRVSIITSILSKLKKDDNWQDIMRLNMCVAEAVEMLGFPVDAAELREQGFSALRNASVKLIDLSNNLKWMCKKAEINQAVRVNMAGTWSDAPPYCFEHGGTMLNAAVSIDGKLPIHVYAEILNEPVIELHSVDLKVEKRFTSINDLSMYKDLTDPFILCKAALAVSGIISYESNKDLKTRLLQLGGGLKIITNVSVPKGSGLGTSSLITGAVIHVLMKLLGQTKTPAELSDAVLMAEQSMTTGGGWQDVIGGMYPGIKITTTKPGIPQIYDVQPLTLPKNTIHQLNNRSFLLYTGQRRLARSVLTRVLTNYICNHPSALKALREIQQLVYVMNYELLRNNITNFAKLLTEHMNLLCIMDKSSSNLMLNHIMDELSDFTDGSTLCGAGGGGFLYGILKEGQSLDDVRRWLKREYEGTAMTVHGCGIC
jgi:fucokinase